MIGRFRAFFILKESTTTPTVEYCEVRFTLGYGPIFTLEMSCCCSPRLVTLDHTVSKNMAAYSRRHLTIYQLCFTQPRLMRHLPMMARVFVVESRRLKASGILRGIGNE